MELSWEDCRMDRVEALSSSSSVSRKRRYDVFLSFRGADTRTNFTDHLYAALVQEGIKTFRDDVELPAGEDIASELQKAIPESRVSVVIFSKDYASSTWCLDELVQIMQRKKTANGHHVLPVFHRVEPSHVRYQIGDFGAAFRELEENGVDKMEKWKKSLKEAADLSGMVLGNRYESGFIRDIVKEIHKKLDNRFLHLPTSLVEKKDLVGEINQWIQDDVDDVGVANIFGTGVGESAIAQIVYEANRERFEGSSFLANVQQSFEEVDGLIHLQRQLLSDLSKTKDITVSDSEEGITNLKWIICFRRVLLVLDSIGDLHQFDAIIGMRELFCPGSKIIITSREKQALGVRGACDYFQVGKRVTQDCGRLPTHMEQSVGKMEQSVGKMEQSVAKIEQSVAKMEQSVAKMQQSVAKMEQSVTRVEKSMTRMERLRRKRLRVWLYSLRRWGRRRK